MKRILFKRKTWKRIGLSALSLVSSVALLGVLFWYTFMYIATPQEEVEFESNGVKIVGTLYYPNDQKGPFPAVLVLPGSGSHTRDTGPLLVQSKAFVKKGFAVLTYDKRGSGESGGTFRREDFENLTEDINNALEFLQSKSTIQSNAIGLATNSESGFFGPQLASERDDIAFIYATVASVVDFASLSIYQMGHLMSKWHDDPKDVDEIMELHEDILNFYMKSDGNPEYFNREKDALQQRMSAACSKYGGSTLPFGCRFGIYTEAYVRRRAYSTAYDPRHYFEKGFETKLFYAFAELDINVPTDASVTALKKIIARNEHHIEYKIWSDIDHDFGEIYWAPYGIYPKGYLDEMCEWAWGVIEKKR